jgi:hypothetical protein
MKGLSTQEDDEFYDTQEKLFAGGMTAENWTKIIALNQLKKSARSHIVHKDIMINLAAVYVIRQDEIPEEINEDIHKAKLAYFEKHAETDPHAFFLRISIQELKHLQNLSRSELNRQWMASSKRIRAVKEFLKDLLPKISLHNFDQTTTNS